jgi:hypothetical protein
MRALIFTVALVLLSGCGDGEGIGAPYIAADVDGIGWRGSASEGVVAYSVDDPEGSGSISTIASRQIPPGNQLLSLNLPNPPAVGTWSLGGDSATAAFMSCPNNVLADCIWWAPIASDPGTLEITAIDPESGRIAGTFTFKGYALGDSTGASRNFTGGRFDIRAPGVFILE